MRLIPISPVLACVLLFSGAAWAQQAPDAPVPSAGGGAGGAPTSTAPAEVASTPAPGRALPQPLTDDLMAAAEAGHRAPLLGEYHGEVGAVVGTGGLRGAYGHINAHPNDHVTVDLRFSTLHAHGYPGVYGGYGPGPYPYADPLLGPRPYPRIGDGWTTQVLGPEQDAPPPPEAPSTH